MGHGRRSRVAEPVASEAGIDRGSGVPRLCASAVSACRDARRTSADYTDYADSIFQKVRATHAVPFSAKGHVMRVKSLIGVVTAVFGFSALTVGPLAQTQAAKPEFQRAPDALERVTWRTRTMVSDDRLTNWD